ncbi:MAG: LysR family transcriptional regulator [Synergistaceae bacterium]|nr:LysR family transcriptional regulator [Synergistaceae bacterium]MBQ6908640.1 LysR family transcriptional regulator [Synergistaceae bacterium]MBQ9897604.1 LysR family transcriptional regulator [Synergistaceae bacterium]MBR0096998.1 LysR family transcriptional regulator [Synergistaceae bacterium]MBR0221778.1 LysR family transcriptional regulator [Synergistaceae bacterium]
MNTKQIDCVLEIAQTKNFNRAAENLFISQPALTYQIKLVEEEIGFKLFDRSSRGAVLTPAGEQFCTTLRNIRGELKRAIEQGQNFSSRYHTNISIGLPMRSAIYFLPDAIEIFERENKGVLITPHYLQLYNASSFLKGEEDILFARLNDVKYIPDIKIYSLFESKIYLITERDDELARKEIIKLEDLNGRVLMVGGGSPPELKIVQQRIIEAINIQHFNSNDRETTLTNIKAHKGVCLAPGFLNDHNNEFAWTRFDCPETVACVLCTHSNDQRDAVLNFVKLLQDIYKQHSDFKI